MQRRQQRGFTLLEIMVVIVILGILASLVVPNLMGNKDQADHEKPSVTSWRWKMPSTCTNWITAVIQRPIKA
jgi:prepilin-type N-terminal cleavage/methylation domain-containing protein